MATRRTLMKEAWAPSASVLLHGLALAVFLLSIHPPTVPTAHERAVRVTLIALAPPQPQPMPAPPPVAIEEPPPVATTADSVAEVAPPPKRPLVRKAKPTRPEPPKPAPEREPAASVAVPASSEVAAAPTAAMPQPSEPAGPSPSYLALLRQKLERNKVYPHVSRSRKEQGTALLRFVVDRHGHVLAHRLDRSTGHRDLDREVEAMLDRAQPLPEMPSEMTQAQIELVVPVQFHLR